MVVSVEASDKFEREGTTIFYKLNLNIVQAAQGDTVEIPTMVLSNWLFQKALRLARNSVYVAREHRAVVALLGTNTLQLMSTDRFERRQKSSAKEFAAAGDLKVNPKKKGFFDHIKDALKENNVKRADWLFCVILKI